jgi:hypothetical protein
MRLFSQLTLSFLLLVSVSRCEDDSINDTSTAINNDEPAEDPYPESADVTGVDDEDLTAKDKEAVDDEDNALANSNTTDGENNSSGGSGNVDPAPQKQCTLKCVKLHTKNSIKELPETSAEISSLAAGAPVTLIIIPQAGHQGRHRGRHHGRNRFGGPGPWGFGGPGGPGGRFRGSGPWRQFDEDEDTAGNQDEDMAGNMQQDEDTWQSRVVKKSGKSHRKVYKCERTCRDA